MPSPEIPTIVPLLLTGILIGSILRKTQESIGWRLILSGSLLGGLGNLAHAAVLPIFQSPEVRQNVVRPPVGGLMADSSVFLISSFVTGAIMVLLILVTAALTLRLRGRKPIEE